MEKETVQFDMLLLLRSPNVECNLKLAQEFTRKNLDFRLVQLLEIRHSLQGQGARASKRIRMRANVFSSMSSFAHFLSVNQSTLYIHSSNKS